jgi:hypothetical protein
MATLRETGEIKDLSEIDDPMRRLVEFYLANGYRLSERNGEFASEGVASEGVASEGVASEVGSPEDSSPTHVRFVRGKAGNGWWSSNMTELHTHVDLARDDETVRVAYEVDTTGQILTEVERSFWQRERQFAERYLRGSTDAPHDLRAEETDRADEKSRGFLSFGISAAIAVFMIIIFLGFLGII